MREAAALASTQMDPRLGSTEIVGLWIAPHDKGNPAVPQLEHLLHWFPKSLWNEIASCVSNSGCAESGGEEKFPFWEFRLQKKREGTLRTVCRPYRTRSSSRFHPELKCRADGILAPTGLLSGVVADSRLRALSGVHGSLCAAGQLVLRRWQRPECRPALRFRVAPSLAGRVRYPVTRYA